MAIALVNKQPHKELFRLVSNPKIAILGLLHEPPEEIRYGATPLRMIEVSGLAPNLVGKQIKHTGKSQAIYLCGSFQLLRDDVTYRCYEATHKNIPWKRQIKKIHPVTKLETGELDFVDLGLINITVQFDAQAPRGNENPTQGGYIYSTDEIQPADVIGKYYIREVRKQYELYTCRFEYEVI